MKFVQTILLVFCSLFFVRSFVFAQTPIPSITLPSPTMTETEYVLPYPGILPDHPLYMLKAFRDRILEFLIVDPVRKAEFYALQADKRLGMGVALFAKGKNDMATRAIAEAENYFSRSVALVKSVKESGKEIPSFLVERLALASFKHLDMLQKLGSNEVVSQARSSMETLIDDIKNLP